MLQLLHIENIAVIEEADITFSEGFNALTGETGAGKSIVIDAMGAVLGQRTSRDLVRTGAAKAFVSARFDGVDASVPEELGLAPEEEGCLILQRELTADGRSSCRVNGRPVTVAQLRQLGTHLLDIHGQHDGQQLLDETQHRKYLDLFGRTESLLAVYRTVYESRQEIVRQLRSLQMDAAEKERRMDTLRHQIADIDRLQLRPGEEEELTARRNLLQNAEKFLAAVSGADYYLNGDEQTQGVVAQVQLAQEALRGARTLDERFGVLAERLAELRSELYDIAETVTDFRQELDFSPEELDELESRLEQIYRARKKYGATVEEVLRYRERIGSELCAMEEADDTALLLEQRLGKVEKQLLLRASDLTQARQAAAQVLEKRVQQELSELDMGKVQFSIVFTEQAADETGRDGIRFLMSANAGEALKPIDRIASGGELARIMLALKNVLAEQDAVGTLVFDEVDTGVSGRAAQRVAEKLAKVSRRKQVLCVTHLPQLAAMADTHYCVQKGERDGRTFTQVLQLDRTQRREELARITGGVHCTEALLQSAEEMLTAAEHYRRSLGE